MAESFSIAVLISGSGTTLKNLLDRKAAGNFEVEVGHVISNNPDAGGLRFASESNISFDILDHRKFESAKSFNESLFKICRETKCDLVVCGGFLRKLIIPTDFENKVINIHPSLIPAFCGKGFYGMRVHKAVIEYGCKLSGCTVHFVDNEFDHGPIIAQRSVEVLPDDSPEQVQRRVFEQECELYPSVIQSIASGKVKIDGRNVTID